MNPIQMKSSSIWVNTSTTQRVSLQQQAGRFSKKPLGINHISDEPPITWTAAGVEYHTLILRQGGKTQPPQEKGETCACLKLSAGDVPGERRVDLLNNSDPVRVM